MVRSLMSSDADIVVANVSKRYRTRTVPPNSRGTLFGHWFAPRREVWALRDICFTVLRGEALGIIGHNGAGKSTIVKMLSGITLPTHGEIRICGTLSALIEVGAGFNIELTGRENVFLAGAILGMSRSEITKRMTEIIEFSGIDDAIDAPVKSYSTGQFLRLGFSIAAQLDSHILLMDEVLAVGDVAFQARCFDRIDLLRRSGKTIVLVSHDLAAVERVCDRAILLEHGKLVMAGEPRAVIEEYSKTAYRAVSFSEASGDIRLVRIEFRGSGVAIRTGDPLTAHVSFSLKVPLADPIVTLAIYWPSGYLCTEMTSTRVSTARAAYKGILSFDFTCPILTLQRGLYRIDVTLEGAAGTAGRWQGCSLLRVDPGMIIKGDFYLEHSCRMTARN
jgi:ABC-type polysaccharide/polyol phosphate transport system ATPase subunit